jgi:hypothetical protein
MQHGDLDKTKVHKTQRDSKIDVRKPNSKGVLKSVQLVRLVLHTCWTYLKASPAHRTYPVHLLDSRDVYQTRLVLDQTSLMSNMTIEI